MKLFDLFRRPPSMEPASLSPTPAVLANANDGLYEESSDASAVRINRDKAQDIPEKVFVEYAKPKPKSTMETDEVRQDINDIHMLYRYLEQNLEKKGYEDALVNPDTSYMEEHVLYINNELTLLIAKVKTYYAAYMQTIDFHIETRKRNGMIETVEELLAHKETILEEIKTVSGIEEFQ